ncbi:maleylpyruvate isomerase family mycothiol-dependent enzyme [Streptomyces albidoflavus]|uniref:maleylpyruvate isomerase family mycothiol-dependent enzyme n=1 Tax=Streptomyces albidoflavus TaxID=1886 RepID=UPI001F5D2D9A|nr:maleylpyruvate isomerase family mycothiol-dependent enzyme [Streptomyces albidoflavus]
MTDPVWASIHAERAALAADLAGLTEEQWATPSLCSGLTVREVLAHLTASASLNAVRWMAGVIRCRFDFDRQVAVRLAEQLGATPAETLERFRSVVASTTKPPLPVVAMLGETLVHGEDIRRPLGLRRDHPVEVVTRVAAYYQGLRPGGRRPEPRRRAAARRGRRPVHERDGSARLGPHPRPGDGDDRADRVLRRPRRRGRGAAALPVRGGRGVSHAPRGQRARTGRVENSSYISSPSGP